LLTKFFSRQARKPSGLFGRWFMTLVFDKGNRALNKRMLELVSATGDQRILEIGFGSGGCVKAMADSLSDGMVEGIDFSDAMMRVAVRRNKKHIASGKVKLVQGDFDQVEYPPGRFDTVCSANTIYFWPDQAFTFSKILGLLKPGGKLILAFVDKNKMRDMTLDMTVFTPVSNSDLKQLLAATGFSEVTVHPLPGLEDVMVCMEAHKSEAY
jgi:ubiquinone/menaquinone biosynthesis C-methylase UbiE